MYKKIVILLVGLIINSSWGAEENNLENNINTPEPVIIKNPKLHSYERKLLKRAEEGKYLVQDFYDTGEKLTDPYLMENPLKLVILNVDNKDYSAISSKDDFYHYRFYNAYDTFAKIEGKLVTWYKSGKKRSEEYYQQGEPINKLILWYENGVKAREIDYISTYIYPHTKSEGINSGTPIEETGFYISGGEWLPNGVILRYKSWYPNGQLWEESDFTRNENYTVKKWYKNGQKKIVYYLSNKSKRELPEITAVKLWDENGKELVNDDKKPAYKHKRTMERSRKLIKKTPDGNIVQEFFANGRKATEPFLTKHELNWYYYDCIDGKVIRYDLDGNKIEERLCVKGNPKSTFASWYSDGQRKALGYYQLSDSSFSARKVGIWSTWYANDQLESEVDYDQPNVPSNFITYYPNGQIKTGKKNGIEIEYGTNPKFYVLEEVEVGCCRIHIFGKDNKKILEYRFHSGAHGEKFGTITEWYDNEHIAAKGKFDLDSKYGLWQYYYEDGSPWMEGKYRSNKQIGIWTYWDKQGNKTEVDKGSK